MSLFEWRERENNSTSFGWLNIDGKRSKVTVFVAEIAESRWQSTVAGIFSSEWIVPTESPDMESAQFVAEMAVLDLFRKFADAITKDRIKRLEELVKHIYVHSGYPKCGFIQMDTPMKRLFEEIIGKVPLDGYVSRGTGMPWDARGNSEGI